jgi:CRP/FNR family transcriptional regulator
VHTEFLKSIPFLQNLSNDIISLLGLKVKSASYKKGEIIFSETEEAKAIFFVKSGIVKIKKGNQQGKEFVVCMKRSGNLFAETSVFCERESTYPGTAQTLADTKVLYLLASDVEEFMRNDPRFSVEMIRFMSGQLRSFADLLSDVALLDVYGKTVKTIERLGNEFGKRTKCGVKIELPLTIQELASIIGTTRESVNRVIVKLKEQGSITFDDKKLVITNRCDFCKRFAETASTVGY